MRLAVSRFWVTVLGLAGVALMALFVTGVIDWDRTTTQARVKMNQTTARLSGAVSLDVSGTTATPAEARAAQQCRQNLRRIEAAKRVVARGRGNAVGAITWQEIQKELGRGKLACPKGGQYSPGTLEMLPTCSISAQQTLDKADDHILDVY